MLTDGHYQVLSFEGRRRIRSRDRKAASLLLMRQLMIAVQTANRREIKDPKCGAVFGNILTR
jgi:hypothetical protein